MRNQEIEKWSVLGGSIVLNKILGAVAILTFIWLVAFKKIDKEENSMCKFNCEYCGENDVCGIKKGATKSYDE